MSYITANIKAAKVFHGYDKNRKLIIDNVDSDGFVEKVIKVDRILSFTEDYIFLECPHNTVQTWEYKETLAEIKEKLKKSGLLVE